MFLQHKPMPGYWYSNLSGQLIQVRAILYTAGKRRRIVLEDIRGRRDHVDPATWQGMEMVLHSPVIEPQQAARDR
jgi:hypothetical protein